MLHELLPCSPMMDFLDQGVAEDGSILIPLTTGGDDCCTHLNSGSESSLSNKHGRKLNTDLKAHVRGHIPLSMHTQPLHSVTGSGGYFPSCPDALYNRKQAIQPVTASLSEAKNQRDRLKVSRESLSHHPWDGV